MTALFSKLSAPGRQMVLALSLSITQLIRKLSGKHTVAEKTAALRSSKANT